jgi:hypothetical protein
VLHLSASFSLFSLFFLFLVGSLPCLVVAGVAEVLCVCVCVCLCMPSPPPSHWVCVCVFCFPAIVHCCTEVKCVVLGEEAPWFGIQVSCWPLLLLLFLLSFSFVFYLFVCLFVATVGF